MAIISCHRCHKDTGLDAHSSVYRSSECPFCSADLRCCKMCRFYDAKSYNECRESQAERITEKNKSNFCGFFELNTNINHEAQKSNQLSAAEALFKK